MDSITQAALGAAIGEAVLGRKIGNKGAIIGGVLGSVPDLDILLMPFYDSLERISLHRGYSHSILICIIGAFIFAYVLSRIKWTKDVAMKRLGVMSFMALFTHVLLDAFTSYGTQLFLPFTDSRVSFDSISVIDPVYTLPLLLGLLGSLFIYKKSASKRSLSNNMGLFISTLYLLFTLVNKHNVQQNIYSQLEEQNISLLQILTVPVSLGNAIWYGVAKDETHLHIGKYSTLKKNRIDFESFAINEDLLQGLDDHLVDRMKWFAKGFYTVAEMDGRVRIYNMQCDMQGIRKYGDYKAPTAFYFEVFPGDNGSYTLKSGMHKKQ